MANHLIKKQVLDIKQKGLKHNDFDEISSIYYSRVIPVLENVFDNVGHDGNVIRIDKLEIDAGIINISNFENEFPEKIKKLLFDKIQKISHGSNLLPDINSKQCSEPESKLELITYFLENGTLPWWSKPIENPEIIFMEVLKLYPDNIKKLLIDNIENEELIKRLLFQFKDDILNKILAAVISKDKCEVIELLIDFNIIYSVSELKTINAEHFRYNIYKSILMYGSEKDNIGNETIYYSKILRYFAYKYNISYKKLITWFYLKTSSIKTASFKLFINREYGKIMNNKDNEYINSVNMTGKSDEPESGKVPEDTIETDTLVDFNYTADSENVSEKGIKTFDDIEGSGYYVENSGLVLLFPYLKSYFVNLNLMRGNEFKNFESRIKALHLLQYLATGKTDNPEYLLILNKILCGIGINVPIAREVFLSEYEKNETESLLISAIENWAVLKNTSIEGFREAFLKRNGILTEYEDKWILKVERKAFDILIERIPWSFSIIKFPWMRKILYVEW